MGATEAMAEGAEGKTMNDRRDKAFILAQRIYWAVEHGNSTEAERLLDEWANENCPAMEDQQEPEQYIPEDLE
jgi:hypothetical protein